MSNMEGENTNSKDINRIRCVECGTNLELSDNECPNCGSTKKTGGHIHFERKLKTQMCLKATIDGEHEAHMSPQSWTILGLILAFVIPPLFYAVFSILTICFWYKLLIWLSIIIVAFFLTKSYKINMFLRSVADKAYGKRKIKG